MNKYEICPKCGGSKESNFGELAGKQLIGTCPTCRGEGRQLTRKYLEAALRQAEADNAALREENDIQRQGIQNLSAQVAVLLKELEEYKTSDISKETALTEYYSRAREAERKLEGLRSGLKQIQDYALEFQGLNTDMKEIADMARQALAAEKEESR